MIKIRRVGCTHTQTVCGLGRTLSPLLWGVIIEDVHSGCIKTSEALYLINKHNVSSQCVLNKNISLGRKWSNNQ